MTLKEMTRSDLYLKICCVASTFLFSRWDAAGFINHLVSQLDLFKKKKDWIAESSGEEVGQPPFVLEFSELLITFLAPTASVEKIVWRFLLQQRPRKRGKGAANIPPGKFPQMKGNPSNN